MIEREEDGLWSHLTESIALHHEEVFACLTTDTGLSRWFPVAAEVEARAGGTMALCWNEDCSRKTTVAILNYDPGGQVVWDWYVGHHDVHAPLYWEVEPSVEQGSIVHLRQGPFEETTDCLAAMVSEVSYWRWYLCNLRVVLEARHDMRKVRPL